MRKTMFLLLCVVFSILIGNAQPTNIDFNSGNINGWTYTEGGNLDSYLMTMSNPTTSTQYSVMTTGAVETNSVPITMTSPLGGDFIRIGKTSTGGISYKLTQTFRVTSASQALAISYAVILQDGNHTCNEQPYFNFVIKDSVGNVIGNSNSHYSIYSASCSSGDPSFITSGSFGYKNWVNSTFSLANYVSTNVTVEYMVSGCVITQAGHIGYAYVDASICNNSFSPNILSVNTNTYNLLQSQNNILVCGTTTANIVAPPGATSYSWTGTGISGLTTQSVSITQSGTYSLVFGNASACSNTTGVTFSVGLNPTVSIVTTSNNVCATTGVTLTASGALTYVWTPNMVFKPKLKIFPTTSQTYTVVGTAANGCVSNAQYSVNVVANPILSISGNSAVCNGSSALFTASGADTYSWSTGALTNTLLVSPTTNTVYTVTGKNLVTGCTSSVSENVSIAGVLSYTPSSLKICLGDSIILNADSSSFLGSTWWYHSVNPNQIILKPLSTTTYTVYSQACGTNSAVITVTVNALPNVIVNSGSICAGKSFTFNPSGAYFYNYINASHVVTPSVTTTYYIEGIDFNNCKNVVTSTVIVNSIPVITVNNGSVCYGSSYTLSPSGANTYSYSSGSNIVSPITLTNYTVTGTDINGCIGTAVCTVSVNQLPNLTITPLTPPISCINPTSSYSITGANTYTWSGPGIISSVNSPTITVNMPGFYYVTGSNISCSVTSGFSVNSNTAIPIVYMSTVTQTICIGSTQVITASATSTAPLSYLWSNSASSQSISVSPTLTTVYSVTVTNSSNGCSDVKTSTINIVPNPIVTSSSNSVCLGSSVNLTVSGVNTCTWSTGSNAFSINDIPLNSSTYTVNTSSGSGCSYSATIPVIVDVNCQDIWPGDANSDGVADNLDVLELGLHYTQTGAPRASVSNNWQSYFANNWTGTITNGSNLNHSDCNGDGTIDDNDTLAIFNNYGLTHTFKTAQTTTVNPQLSIVPDQSMVVKGTFGSASIYFGDATTTINNINGVAFTVDFDNTLIEPNSIWVEYQNSFIDAGQNLHFRKLDFVNNKLFTASTHTVSNNVSGYGKIATLHYQVKSSLSTDEVLNIGILQANQSSATGSITPLSTGTGTLMAIGASVGVKESLISGGMLVSPNPTNGLLNISFNTIPQNTKIELYNSIGALVLTEQMSNKTNTINMSDLSSGIYFMKVLESNKVVAVKKVVRE